MAGNWSLLVVCHRNREWGGKYLAEAGSSWLLLVVAGSSWWLAVAGSGWLPELVVACSGG